MYTFCVILLLIFLIIVFNVVAILAVMLDRNINYYKKGKKKLRKAKFTEKDATLPDGSTIHYGESCDNGMPALLLIHGQARSWEDYLTVLPELSVNYHIYAVDCYGHGKSSKKPEKYNAKAMGEDLIWFIRNIIKSPAVVSGHSSGGLLTAWIAANASDDVSGVVLEDPPFFWAEPGGRWEKSFAYIDTYVPIHRFLNQSEEKDWIIFYIKNSGWAKFVGEKGRKGILKYAVTYRKKHPNRPLQFFFLPVTVNRMFLFMNSYDLRFGETFYDNSWFVEYNQAEVLKRIKCPSVLLHSKGSNDENGILMAAMSQEDAVHAHELMNGNRLIEVISGHDFHYERPEEFIKILRDFQREINNNLLS